MGLNIKNERVHELAREAARRTGKSQTSVIEEALSRLLAEFEREPKLKDRVGSVQQVLADIDHRLSGQDLTRLTTDDLYDDSGLPA
jgi:antitoxin VapB